MALDNSSTPVNQWRTFLHQSLTTRLDVRTFNIYLSILQVHAPLPSSQICDIFLHPTDYNDAAADPRVPRYLLAMLKEEIVNVEDILGALLRFSSFDHIDFGVTGLKMGDSNDKYEHLETTKKWQNSYATEESMFYRLAKYISSGTAPRDSRQALGLVVVATKWIDTVSKAFAYAAKNPLLSSMAGEGAIGERMDEMSAVLMALGTFVTGIVENPRVIDVFGRKGGGSKEISRSFNQQLLNFIPFLSQTSPQSAARLELFQSQNLVHMQPVSKKVQGAGVEFHEMIDDTMGLGIDSIVVTEIPVMNSRPGLYIWLNSLLIARPLIDDGVIFGYLHNRYLGDLQTTTIDLILASFDILANATDNRSEGSQTTTLLKSFLINKLPLLLVTLSRSYYPPLTSEYCITEALSHVDTNAFPTLSSMFDEPTNSSNNIFSDSIRSDFCFACCLHGMIPESSIESLLGDVPMQSLPAGGRYEKETLVQQCLSEPSRVDGLIEELGNMDGNVGAVSQAITEVMGRLCSNKETMSLKTLCIQLIRRPNSLDVMLLFDKATTILRPICDLIDRWRYDDDQGEYQPVYEEFGSILLLLLSFVHRYNLSPADLGIRSNDSFVVKLLSQGYVSRALDSLTIQEQGHLDGWIRGFFDNESSGLGDELMSSCPPHGFYLLVPTLFHHIVLAYNTNYLTEEGLKGGLEFLADTFLLPSLIPAIFWLGSHLWESRGDSNVVLLILRFLITKPPSGLNQSSEASQMLRSILNIVSTSLEHSLRFLQRAEPARQDIEPLLHVLKSSLHFERRGAADHSELESWVKTEGGGLVPSVKQTIISLVPWGLNPGMNIMPASYTHRQILTALKILGAKRLLFAILDEVKTQMESGNGSVVIDIAVALICAPDCSSFSDDRKSLLGSQKTLEMLDADASAPKPLERRMNLREALEIEVDSAPKTNKMDPMHAETVVRLWKRVKAQMAPQSQLGLGLQTGLMESAAGDAAELHSALDAAMGGGGDGLADVGMVIGGLGAGMEGSLMGGLMSAGREGEWADGFIDL